MVIPPPVKFIAFLAVSLEAMLQPGAMMFGLPWKLIEPVNAKTHAGVGNESNLGNGCRAYVDSGQTKHFCQVRWLLLANNGTNATAGRLIDLHGLCRTCRGRVSTRIRGREGRRTNSDRQIVCHDRHSLVPDHRYYFWRSSMPADKPPE